MNFGGKKGISAIVATVLIILITVAAVAIIWAVVIPMIQNQLVSSEVFEIRSTIVTSGGYTVYNLERKILFVQVEQTGNASRLEIVVSSQGISHIFNLPNAPGNNQKKTYEFDLTDIFDDLTGEISVKVVPYFVSSFGKEIAGTPSSEIMLEDAVLLSGICNEGETRETTCGVGYCERTGTEICTNQAWVDDTCVAGLPYWYSYEVCNNVDDDCDGQIDEELSRSAIPKCGIGACVRYGTETCTAGVWGDYTCTAGIPAATEDCTKLPDEDCDGFSNIDDEYCASEINYVLRMAQRTFYFASDYKYSIGFEFIPANDYYVRELCRYHKTPINVAIYDESHNLLVSQEIGSNTVGWACESLDTPLLISSGEKYHLVGFFTSGYYLTQSFSTPAVYNNLELTSLVFQSGGVLFTSSHTQKTDNRMFGVVDLGISSSP